VTVGVFSLALLFVSLEYPEELAFLISHLGLIPLALESFIAGPTERISRMLSGLRKALEKRL